jgi:hypothetical protein
MIWETAGMNIQPHAPQGTTTDVSSPLLDRSNKNSCDNVKTDTARSSLHPDEPERDELDAVVWLSMN